MRLWILESLYDEWDERLIVFAVPGLIQMKLIVEIFLAQEG